MRELSPPQLARLLADSPQAPPLLLDVRQPWEFQLCHLKDAQLVPLHTLPQKIGELDPQRTVVCVCHHGIRSRQAGAFLEHQGFADVINLTGGIDAWADQVDPAMAKY